MSTIWLNFSDKTLQTALLATFQGAWAYIQWQTDALPEKLPPHALVITDKPQPQFPADRVYVLDAIPQPPKLQTVLRHLEDMLHQTFFPDEIAVGNAVLDTRTREWRHGDTCVDLTEKEVALIVYLKISELPATREDLLRDVWQYATGVDTHTIETHIYRLRQKIETDPAEPVFLMTTKNGYQLAAVSSA